MPEVVNIEPGQHRISGHGFGGLMPPSHPVTPLLRLAIRRSLNVEQDPVDVIGVERSARWRCEHEVMVLPCRSRPQPLFVLPGPMEPEGRNALRKERDRA